MAKPNLATFDQALRIFGVFFFSAVVFGCANTMQLDTPNKRAYAVAIAYEQALDTVTLWSDEGRLTEAQGQQVAKAILDWRKAKADFDLAEGVLGQETALGKMSAALQLLRGILAAQEAQ